MRLGDGLKFAKPKPRKKVKAAEDRKEAAVKKEVRQEVEGRDGYCRLERYTDIVGLCSGPSEWNHLRRRSETVGMEPEERHNSETSCMNCQRHHQMIDGRTLSLTSQKIYVDYTLTPRGANGPLGYTFRGKTWRED